MKKITLRIHGFTLIELIIVIIILGIIASISLPKFLNLKSRAIQSQEDKVAGSLNVAIKTYNLSYIVNGGDPISYPGVNPFSLLSQFPPYVVRSWEGITYGDGITWQLSDNIWNTCWWIFCPHRLGDKWGLNASKGRFYMYKYGNVGSDWGHKPGDFWLYEDVGH